MSDLNAYHNHIVLTTGASNSDDAMAGTAAAAYDDAHDLAGRLLDVAGINGDMTDDLGARHNDDVLTLLTMALYRSSDLRLNMAAMVDQADL